MSPADAIDHQNSNAPIKQVELIYRAFKIIFAFSGTLVEEYVSGETSSCLLCSVDPSPPLSHPSPRILTKVGTKSLNSIPEPNMNLSPRSLHQRPSAVLNVTPCRHNHSHRLRESKRSDRHVIVVMPGRSDATVRIHARIARLPSCNALISLYRRRRDRRGGGQIRMFLELGSR